MWSRSAGKSCQIHKSIACRCASHQPILTVAETRNSTNACSSQNLFGFAELLTYDVGKLTRSRYVQRWASSCFRALPICRLHAPAECWTKFIFCPSSERILSFCFILLEWKLCVCVLHRGYVSRQIPWTWLHLPRLPKRRNGWTKSSIRPSSMCRPPQSNSLENWETFQGIFSLFMRNWCWSLSVPKHKTEWINTTQRTSAQPLCPVDLTAEMDPQDQCINSASVGTKRRLTSTQTRTMWRKGAEPIHQEISRFCKSDVWTILI